jgi:hypothetical protein
MPAGRGEEQGGEQQEQRCCDTTIDVLGPPQEAGWFSAAAFR